MTTLTDPMMRPPEAEIPKTLYHAAIILVLVLLALIATAGCAQAQVPPEIEALTDEEWTVDLPETYAGSTATGDWFLKHGEMLGAYIDSAGYVKMPEIGAPLFSTQDLAATADSVLNGEAPYDGQSLWIRRVEAISTFRALADSLETE